jgi:hypothetical protein
MFSSTSPSHLDCQLEVEHSTSRLLVFAKHYAFEILVDSFHYVSSHAIRPCALREALTATPTGTEYCFHLLSPKQYVHLPISLPPSSDLSRSSGGSKIIGVIPLL